MEYSENSCLLCKEDESSLNEQYHYKDENLGFCSVSEFDSEYIEMLIQKETIFQSNTKNFSVYSERSWFKWARREAIKWIFDNGKLWAIRLLSVACLSLAAKMEECEAPALSEYHVDEYNFEGNVIQRMELLVLNTLEWKMGCVTPCAYLNYFTNKFCGEFRRNDLINRAVELILAVMGEVNVMEHRPSIIAAAAVLAACDYHLTEKLVEIKMDLVPSWGSLEKEHIYYCYNLLQEIGMSKSNTSGLIISHNLSSTHSSSIDVLDDSIITSTVGEKRKLTYTNGDQHCPQLKIPKSY
ncbi:hypothetical protein DH2020_040935 [Rehmannia glutinosa]|uniref:Cyclin C-terminal domain-containing protein n=1 Tax=Rehmannia glutinosa TaxID=99300 RepID=A0ABR0URK6_REHGL